MLIDDNGWNKLKSLRRKYYSSKLRIRKLYLYQIWKKQMNKFNAWIPFASSIDEDVIFPHGIYGVFISKSAQIGKGTVIFQQVTIGSNTLTDSKGNGAPVIEENCYIGVGAKVIGNVHVGKNCRIGANCVVTKDIPDYATVVLEHPRVIIYDKPKDNRFIDML